MDFLNEIGDAFSSIGDTIGDALDSAFQKIIHDTIYTLCYYIETGLCWIVGVLEDLFEVFAGLDTVTNNGKETYLIDVFFSNTAVSNIYTAMALIGIALTFGFTIWAVVRKMFDLSARQQQSMGQIITSAIRSIFLILGLTLVMNVVLYSTGILMQQIDFIFNNAYHLNEEEERTFTAEEYAAMGRVLSTIGNYSAVPNSNNRYNLNLCYNDIRSDLAFLQQQGVFRYSYYITDKNGQVVQSWQSVLAQIVRSTDPRYDVKVDVYNEGVASSLTAAMDYLRENSTTTALQSVKTQYAINKSARLDHVLFLMGTMEAAKNGAYNVNPSMEDALRKPYYYGEGKDIYDLDDVDSDFDIGFATNYITVWIAAVALIFDLVTIVLNCIARIFNMLFLYVIAPPFIAVSPLDNGGKFKQWTTAFIVQSLSVFGTVIAMRLLLIYMPIVLSPQLVLFENNAVLNWVGKFLLIFGGTEAAKKSTGLLTGILADSAGWQAVQAGDMSSTAGKMIGTATGAAKTAAKLGGKGLVGGGKLAYKAATYKSTEKKEQEAAKKEAQKNMRVRAEQYKLENYGELTGSQGGGGSALPSGGRGVSSEASSPSQAQRSEGGSAEAPSPPQAQRGEGGSADGDSFTLPPAASRVGSSADAESAQNPRPNALRERMGFPQPGGAEGSVAPRSKDDSSLPSSNRRPTLDAGSPSEKPPQALPREKGGK